MLIHNFDLERHLPFEKCVAGYAVLAAARQERTVNSRIVDVLNEEAQKDFKNVDRVDFACAILDAFPTEEEAREQLIWLRENQRPVKGMDGFTVYLLGSFIRWRWRLTFPDGGDDAASTALEVSYFRSIRMAVRKHLAAKGYDAAANLLTVGLIVGGAIVVPKVVFGETVDAASAHARRRKTPAILKAVINVGSIAAITMLGLTARVGSGNSAALIPETLLPVESSS